MSTPVSPPTPAPTHGFTTAQVHAGDLHDGAHGSRITPVHLTAGFRFDSLDEARDRFAGDDDGYLYTRVGNPSIAALERRLAALEGGDHAIAVGSGQAAVTVALLGLLRAGDHIVIAGNLYLGSRNLVLENFSRFGITATVVADPSDADQWRSALRPTTRALLAESVSNPTQEVLDIAAVAEVAHSHGVPLVVDNTLATPYLVRPIEHGADVVVHSASKFLAGHGAVIGGAIVIRGHEDYARFARDTIAARFGPTLSPLNAFLIQQGIETLSLRMRQHSANALAVARWLEDRPEVLSVDYAGLASSPWQALAARYLPRGAGGVVSFTLAGGESAARALVESVRLFSHMTHLGDVRSIILHPATTSHAGLSEDERRAARIWPGTIRLSVGIEDIEDLLADLGQALDACAACLPAPRLAAAH